MNDDRGKSTCLRLPANFKMAGVSVSSSPFSVPSGKFSSKGPMVEDAEEQVEAGPMVEDEEHMEEEEEEMERCDKEGSSATGSRPSLLCLATARASKEKESKRNHQTR